MPVTMSSVIPLLISGPKVRIFCQSVRQLERSTEHRCGVLGLLEKGVGRRAAAVAISIRGPLKHSWDYSLTSHFLDTVQNGEFDHWCICLGLSHFL